MDAILDKANLGHLKSKFQKEGVETPNDVLQLDDSDLADLGVEKMMDRKRLRNQCKDTKGNEMSTIVKKSVMEEINISEAGGEVVLIDGDQYSLRVPPAVSSALVSKMKVELLGPLDLKSLVSDLSYVGSFIRLAYNGVAGETELQIKVQAVGYKVVDLCDMSAVTISAFSRTSSEVIDTLKNVYDYLLDEQEEMALITLEETTSVAKKMEEAAEKLSTKFEEAANQVQSTLEDTQRAKGLKFDKIVELEGKRKEMEVNVTRLKAVRDDTNQALQEYEEKSSVIEEKIESTRQKTLEREEKIRKSQMEREEKEREQYFQFQRDMMDRLETKRREKEEREDKLRREQQEKEKKEKEEKERKQQEKEQKEEEKSNTWGGWFKSAATLTAGAAGTFAAGATGGAARVLTALIPQGENRGTATDPDSETTTDPYKGQYESQGSSDTHITMPTMQKMSEPLYVEKDIDTGIEDKKKERAEYIQQCSKLRGARSDAIIQIQEQTARIQNCQTEEGMAEATVEALHGAIGGLKNLSAIMKQTSLFWKQVGDHCSGLVQKGVRRQIEAALKLSEDNRRKVWRGKPFMTQAVNYFAKWVTLHSVCSEYMEQIKITQKDLYNYIKENPTVEESRTNVKNLASKFKKELDKAIENINQEDTEAKKEIKSLAPM